MKRIKSLLLSFLLITANSACSGSGSDSDSVKPELGISSEILNNGFSFSNEEGSKEFFLRATMEPSAHSNESWCKVVVTPSASEYAYQCTVTANKNETLNERIATITVTVSDIEKKLTVVQQAGSYTGTGDSEAAFAVAKSLGLGWNLGNQLDAYSNGVANETVWGNQFVTQATFNKLAEAGITSVRIPVTWLGKVGAAPTYTIDKEWLDRVAECVGFAEKAGLKVILNIHHDGADSQHWLDIKNAALNAEVNQAVKNQLAAMWKQIAGKFADKGEFLIFESLNEVHDGGWGWGANRTDGGKQYATLNEWNAVFVEAVRNVGGENSTRYLGIPGYCTNPELTVNHLVLPNDPANRLMVSVHFYDPYRYALNDEYSEWGHTGATGKKDPDGDEENVKAVFAKLKSAYIDKGIPVYIGEMGSVHRSTDRAESFRKYYLEYVCKAAKTYGMAPFYWDNGSTGAGKECSGLFERATGAFVNNGHEIVEVMKRAVLSEEAAYTLETVYKGAPK